MNGLIAALFFWAIIAYLLSEVFKMIDINALEKEVNDEIAKESREKAKRQLKEINRDIANAEQIVANLKRKKTDLLVSIGEGTN